MNAIAVGIVDYGVGNHTSIIHSLKKLGCRIVVSSDINKLNSNDLLILPGVGAFPTAASALHERGLFTYIQDWAKANRPLIGICLGMQLLADASYEHGYTAGLKIVPGEIVSLGSTQWHIGWNTVDCLQSDPLFQSSHRQAFYFNHSFIYQGPQRYHICCTHHHRRLISVIRNGNTVGLQFHPEKSQSAGKELLKCLIDGFVNA